MAPAAASTPTRSTAPIVETALAPVAGANGGELLLAPSTHTTARQATTPIVTSAENDPPLSVGSTSQRDSCVPAGPIFRPGGRYLCRGIERRGMYDDILLPTDASDVVGTAVREAVDLAALSGAVLHVLYVEERPSAVPAPDGPFLSVETAARERGERAVAEVRHRAIEAGVDARTAIREGEPAAEVVDYAHEHTDAIVMGTHGRSGIRKVMLGSVTETVVRRAEVPVLVTHTEG